MTETQADAAAPARAHGSVAPAGTAARAVAWALVACALTAASGAAWLRTQDVTFTVALTLAAQAIAGPMFAAVGAVIVHRHPRHPMGWLFLFLGTVGAVDELTRGVVARQEFPSELPWMPAVLLVSGVAGDLLWIGYAAVLPLLFPDGRLPSRRWRPLLWALVGVSALASIGGLFVEGPLQVWVDGEPVDAVRENPLGVAPFGIDLDAVVDAVAAAALVFVVAGLAALVVRWRRDAVARQQIKWFLLGFGVAVAGIFLTAIPAIELAGDLVSSLAFAALPVAMGIAITRHRLYEIDRIVSRAVAYLLVVTLLVAVYAGAVLALGAAARAMTGGASDLVVAMSTLLVAALFQPLRIRVQHLVDRKFNRRRYDAEKASGAFGRSLRDELDRSALVDSLRDAAMVTLQPAFVTVHLVEGAGQRDR